MKMTNTANTIKVLLAAACAGIVLSCTPAPGRAAGTVSVGGDRSELAPLSPAAAPETTPSETASPDWFLDPETQVAIVTKPPADRATEEKETRFAADMTRIEFEQIEGPARPVLRPDPMDPTRPVDPDEEAVEEEVTVIIEDPDAIERPEKIIEIDPTKPVMGGKARISLQRGFLDDVAADLLRRHPFGGASGEDRRVLAVTDSTHRRLEFKFSDDVRRADGRKATSLDFIETWSRFIASRPAQGLAMFRNVQGVEGFISGKDPLVSGFSAADEKTIRVRLANPDPLAFHRMNTPKLVGMPFMLGTYHSAGTKDTETRLLPNKNSLADTAYLEEIVILAGSNPEPMLKSFFEGEYSAIALHGFPGLDALVNKEAAGGATLRRLPSDRYFLACKPAVSEQTRNFVRSAVNGADLLKNVVKAEGEEIGSVSTNDAATEIPRGQVPVPQSTAKPFKILYRADDPVSKTVAQKISGDLNRAGMKTEAAGSNAEAYEKALVSKQYDCAVGWVAETVLKSETEQLHLATIWFNDITDPQVRLRDCLEIPLFSISNYLLFRNNVRFHGGRLSGMWIDNSNIVGSAADADEAEE